jgi:hypothetical protein
MASQLHRQQCQSCEEKGFALPLSANADRKAIGTLLVIDNLWRQIDRWVNEGGALGNDKSGSQL